MKQNLEISLKYFILMIVFFACILCFPVFSYLNENNLINYDHFWAIILGVCVSLPVVLYIDLVLKHSELKLKVKELETKAKNEGFYRTVSAQTITDYDNQIKRQESHINDIKQAFEDAVAEINELRIQISALKEVNNMLLNVNSGQKSKITYWKERALHQKHTKKEVNAYMWECISDNMANFTKGVKYRDSGRKTLSSLIWLENDGHTYLTHKQNFKPVKP